MELPAADNALAIVVVKVSEKRVYVCETKFIRSQCIIKRWVSGEAASRPSKAKHRGRHEAGCGDDQCCSLLDRCCIPVTGSMWCPGKNCGSNSGLENRGRNAAKSLSVDPAEDVEGEAGFDLQVERSKLQHLEEGQVARRRVGFVVSVVEVWWGP